MSMCEHHVFVCVFPLTQALLCTLWARVLLSNMSAQSKGL